MFKETTKQFSKILLFKTFRSNVWEFHNCSTLLPTFGIAGFFILAFVVGVKYFFVVFFFCFVFVLFLHPPYNHGCWTPLHVLIGHLYVYLYVNEVSVQIFSSLFYWIICLFLLTCRSSLYVPDMNLLSNIQIENIFPSLWLDYWFYSWYILMNRDF